MSQTKTDVIRPGDPKNVTFDDYKGQPNLVKMVKQWITLLSDRDKFQQMGAQFINGLLFYGEPGTGKTLLSKTKAGEAGIAFILDERIVRVSIIRRLEPLDYVLLVPNYDIYAMPLRLLVADIMVSMAGHVAVKIFLGEYWTGASSGFQNIRNRVWTLASPGYFGAPIADPASLLGNNGKKVLEIIAPTIGLNGNGNGKGELVPGPENRLATGNVSQPN